MLENIPEAVGAENILAAVGAENILAVVGAQVEEIQVDLPVED